MRKTLKYRLYSSKKDKHLIEQIYAAASIWNHAVALTRRYYRMYGKHLGVNRLMKHIAKLRRKNPYWQKVGSQAVQDVCQRLDKAYQRFFADPKAGRPSFKKRMRYRSFTLKQAGWKLTGGNRLRVGKRTYKFCLSRPIDGVVKTVTVKRDACGEMWVCFSVVTESPNPRTVGDKSRVKGLDFGLKTFLTTSDRTEYRAPEPFRLSLSEMAKCQRTLSRKKKGSNQRKKARLRVAKLHRSIADQRRDWHFKLAHTVCDGTEVVCIEDLNLSGMKALWGRKVSDLGYAQFVQILDHVVAKRGKTLVKVDRYYASSKTCSACSHKVDVLPLSVRHWVCPSCGSVHDRDVNAAVNIQREGASSLGLGDVRRPSAAVAA